MTILSTGNVGIGTTAPAFTLDVTGSMRGSNITVNTNAAAGGTNHIMLHSSNALRFAFGLQTVETGSLNGGANLNLYTYADDGAFITSALNVQRSTGFIGMGVSPSYRLDINGGTTAASVNMTSWPRVPVGNTYVAKGIVAYRTNAIQFSNALQDINAQLAVVTNDATNGTYFQIRRSGIWSIRIGPIFHGAAVSTAVLDVSTNISNLSLPALQTPRTIDLFYSTLSNSTLTYTGYLPASTSLNYKPYNNNTTLTNNSNSAVFMLSFIAETPTGSANYPYTSYPT
jgi:hypothetical protein